MTRLPLGRRGPTKLVALVTVASAALASAAYAQQTTERPKPSISSAPRAVGFLRAATIEGRLENSTPGDVVVLERAGAGRSFSNIARERVDDRGRVVFRVTKLRRTARYRLAHTDELDVTTRSGDRRVRVRPRLGARLRRAHVMKGRRITVAGRLRPAEPGRKVSIQRRGRNGWWTVENARVRHGRYRARLGSGSIGRHRVRVRFGGDQHNTSNRRVRSLRVYDPELATWYGPGFYGNRTACGRRLGYSTLGVAHRSLPCGTELSLLYQGRTVQVRVIDRGPYSSADYDLTRETADRLNFSGKDHVGVVREQ